MSLTRNQRKPPRYFDHEILRILTSSNLKFLWMLLYDSQLQKAHVNDDKDNVGFEREQRSDGIERQVATVSGIMSSSEFDSLELTPSTKKVRPNTKQKEGLLISWGSFGVSNSYTGYFIQNVNWIIMTLWLQPQAC